MPSDSSFTMFDLSVQFDLLGAVHELSSDLSHDSVVNFLFQSFLCDCFVSCCCLFTEWPGSSLNLAKSGGRTICTGDSTDL